MTRTRKCKACGEEVIGRSDKIFCDIHCKSSYQYQTIKNDTASLHYQITNQLRKNRKILKSYNKAGIAVVRRIELKKKGFNPRIFTHHWKTKAGKTYLFVYEYGFQLISENGKVKYLLIKWQEYMNKQIGMNLPKG